MSAFIIVKKLPNGRRQYINGEGNVTGKQTIARRWDCAFDAWAWLVNRCALQFKRSYEVVRLRPHCCAVPCERGRR